MLARMMGAARLSVETYEEVEHDRSATPQALLVVVAVAIATGVGGVLGGGSGWVDGVLLGVIRGVISWTLWALAALFVGTKLLSTAETEADWGQLARGTGFAQTPGLLNVLVFIPVVGLVIFIVTWVWQVAAMVVAVRQMLDYRSTLRAIFVILIAVIPVIIGNVIVYWALSLAGIDLLRV